MDMPRRNWEQEQGLSLNPNHRFWAAERLKSSNKVQIIGSMRRRSQRRVRSATCCQTRTNSASRSNQSIYGSRCSFSCVRARTECRQNWKSRLTEAPLEKSFPIYSKSSVSEFGTQLVTWPAQKKRKSRSWTSLRSLDFRKTNRSPRRIGSSPTLSTCWKTTKSVWTSTICGKMTSWKPKNNKKLILNTCLKMKGYLGMTKWCPPRIQVITTTTRRSVSCWPMIVIRCSFSAITTSSPTITTSRSKRKLTFFKKQKRR